MSELRVGPTRGFLFADLRGYTRYVEAHGDAAASRLLGVYRTLVRASVAEFDGAEIRTEGDGVYVVFPSASSAVQCGLAILDAAKAAADPVSGRALTVGVGVHAGETVETTEGPVGLAVNLAARVCAVARPGELLVTETVRALTRTVIPVAFVDRGRPALKGIAEPVRVFACAPADVHQPVRPSRPRTQRARQPIAGALVGVIAVAVIVGVAATRGLGAATASSAPSATTTGASGSLVPSASVAGSGGVATLRPIAWTPYPGDRSETPFGGSSDPGLFIPTSLAGVTAHQEGYLIVGTDREDSAAGAWYSSNVLKWRRLPLVPTDAHDPLDIVTPLPSLAASIVIGSRCSTPDTCVPAVWWTDDPGSTWQEVAPENGWPFGAVFTGVGAGDAGYVVVGSVQVDGATRPIVWVSRDGRSWTTHEATPPPSAVMRDVIGHGGALVAIGTADGAAAAWRSDGASWDVLPAGDAFEGATLRSITSWSDVLVIVGEQRGDPAIWRSLDGTSWTVEPRLPNLSFTTLRGVASGPAGLVVVGDGVAGGVVLTGRQAPSG